MKQKEIGLYIHIPFCKHKCNYCDFCSYENKEQLIPDYIECLQTEIQEVGKAKEELNESKVDKIESKDGKQFYKYHPPLIYIDLINYIYHFA